MQCKKGKQLLHKIIWNEEQDATIMLCNLTKKKDSYWD